MVVSCHTVHSLLFQFCVSHELKDGTPVSKIGMSRVSGLWELDGWYFLYFCLVLSDSRFTNSDGNILLFRLSDSTKLTDAAPRWSLFFMFHYAPQVIQTRANTPANIDLEIQEPKKSENQPTYSS